MKAITILQPYASLIALPDDDDRAKRVENRNQPWHFRGQVAIHAGKGRSCLDGDNYGIPPRDMAFGAVVAVARLAGCFALLDPREGYPAIGGAIPDAALRRWPWLAGHAHVEGPHCLVLAEVRPLAEPVWCKGALGLWSLSDADAALVREHLTESPACDAPGGATADPRAEIGGEA